MAKVLIITGIIVVIALAIVVWIIIRKVKSNVKQGFWNITGISDVTEPRLPVVEAGRYAVDEATGEAFTIREDRQLYDCETGKMAQIVCGWNANALDVESQKKDGDIDKKNISALASRITADSKLQFDRKKTKSVALMWAGIIGTILAIGIVIPLLMSLGSGSVKMPTIPNPLQDIKSFQILPYILSLF